jgi:hypothetical protein
VPDAGMYEADGVREVRDGSAKARTFLASSSTQGPVLARIKALFPGKNRTIWNFVKPCLSARFAREHARTRGADGAKTL